MKFFSILFLLSSYGVSVNKTYIKNFYPNKNIKEEGWINNNKKTDYWFYYYENGNKKEEGHYKNNQKTNWWIYYDKNQKIIKKSEYKSNLLNGITIVYSKGEITKAEKYTNGKKIKTWTDLDDFKRDNNYFLN